MQKKGVNALAISSAQTPAQNRAVLAALRCRPPAVSIVYAAPETATAAALGAALRELHSDKLLALIAVDEAHCVSQWGHDFRPAFARLGRFALRSAPSHPRVTIQ